MTKQVPVPEASLDQKLNVISYAYLPNSPERRSFFGLIKKKTNYVAVCTLPPLDENSAYDFENQPQKIVCNGSSWEDVTKTIEERIRIRRTVPKNCKAY